MDNDECIKILTDLEIVAINNGRVLLAEALSIAIKAVKLVN